MAGKPIIVAILAGMVVAMIGVVFMQKSPQGFVVSGLMHIADGEEEALEEQLRKEAAAQLAAEKAKAVEPNSITVIKSSNQRAGDGLDVAIQAQGKNSRSAMDYMNELLIRYARRQGKVEESIKVKQEIAESDRKLEAAIKEKQVTTTRIESTEREISQLKIREQIEAQRLALEAQAPPEAPPAPKVEAPMAAAKIPTSVETKPKTTRIEETPELPDVENSPPTTAPSLKAEVKRRPRPSPPAIEEEPALNDPAPITLTEEERIELIEALKIYKADRSKLINGGRRSSHPKVREVEDLIRDTEQKLKSGLPPRAANRKVNFEYVAEEPGESPLILEFRQSRENLEKSLITLNERFEGAVKVEIAQKARLKLLIEQHGVLDAAFKPVLLAPVKVITQVNGPFPIGRFVGVLGGALVAAVVGFLIARLGEERRVIQSVSEAEAILRMPVQTLEKTTVRRRAA